MKKTLILEGLGGLNRKERQSFLRFIHSPYFNRREDLVRLVDFLLGDEDIKMEELSKKDVFHALYPDSPYDDQKIRLLLSYLQKKLETFLTIEELKQSEGEKAWLMLSAMQKRNLPRNYARKLNYFEHRLGQQERRDGDYYYEKYRVELVDLDTAAISRGKKSINYKSLTDSLDSFYLSAKLSHACTALMYQSVVDQGYQFPLLDDVLKIASQEKFSQVPAVSIYYLFIKVMNGGEEVDFAKLKNTLFEHRNVLSSQEFQNIYTMVLNFYVQRINRHELEFVPEALSFYKKGIDLGLLLENGYFPRFKYSNIVALALQEGETDWVAGFIEKYRNLLRKKVRMETYSLNRARLEYALKNYDRSLEFIEKVNYDELVYAITARILKIKIYWETNELALLDHQLHSLKYFLTRKKVVGYHYKNWTNVIKYIKKLANVNPFDNETVENLKMKIQSEEILTEKRWLLEQLDEL